MGLQRQIQLLCSRGWCQVGRRLEKGLFWQELGVLPVLGHPRGLALQSSGMSFILNVTLFPPSPTHPCSDLLPPHTNSTPCAAASICCWGA